VVVGKLEIIVEFCAKGSLLHHLRAKRNGKEKEKLRKHFREKRTTRHDKEKRRRHRSKECWSKGKIYKEEYHKEQSSEYTILRKPIFSILNCQKMNVLFVLGYMKKIQSG